DLKHTLVLPPGRSFSLCRLCTLKLNALFPHAEKRVKEKQTLTSLPRWKSGTAAHERIFPWPCKPRRLQTVLGAPQSARLNATMDRWDRRRFLACLGVAVLAPSGLAQQPAPEAPTFPLKVAVGAELRALKSETYDPAYVRLAYPMG